MISTLQSNRVRRTYLGFEGMFDVYAYEGLTFDEICAPT